MRIITSIVAFLSNIQAHEAAACAAFGAMAACLASIPARLAAAYARARPYRAAVSAVVGLVALSFALVASSRVAHPLGQLVALPLVAASIALAVAFAFDRRTAPAIVPGVMTMLTQDTHLDALNAVVDAEVRRAREDAAYAAGLEARADAGDEWAAAIHDEAHAPVQPTPTPPAA